MDERLANNIAELKKNLSAGADAIRGINTRRADELPWLTVEQGAERAQLSKKTLYAEVRAGRLRAARVGGRRVLRFRAEWIDQWLDKSAPE